MIRKIRNQKEALRTDSTHTLSINLLMKLTKLFHLSINPIWAGKQTFARCRGIIANMENTVISKRHSNWHKSKLNWKKIRRLKNLDPSPEKTSNQL
jgi:hypothetical protein